MRKQFLIVGLVALALGGGTVALVASSARDSSVADGTSETPPAPYREFPDGRRIPPCPNNDPPEGMICLFYEEPPPGYRACTEAEEKGEDPRWRDEPPRCWKTWQVVEYDPHRGGPPPAPTPAEALPAG